MNATYVIHTVSLNKLPPAAPALYWGRGRWGGLKNANEYKTIGSALRIVRRMVEAGLWTPTSVSVRQVRRAVQSSTLK